MNAALKTLFVRRDGSKTENIACIIRFKKYVLNVLHNPMRQSYEKKYDFCRYWRSTVRSAYRELDAQGISAIIAGNLSVS
ncbi:hypothetical protein U27_00533 [Candidatus Vecturithrix granuli]|uniref:Uncharacterized protein n=1 Tax=Vecturithrix granuli TaxID=1499967 RepID=A0A081C7T1_VECG1|nr:hypothetical protein U27_00533 [Candidatus Vecturithrix granuli]